MLSLIYRWKNPATGEVISSTSMIIRLVEDDVKMAVLQGCQIRITLGDGYTLTDADIEEWNLVAPEIRKTGFKPERKTKYGRGTPFLKLLETTRSEPVKRQRLVNVIDNAFRANATGFQINRLSGAEKVTVWYDDGFTVWAKDPDQRVNTYETPVTFEYYDKEWDK